MNFVLLGTLLATTLLIPGLAMVVGGIKHRSQRFNPTSAGVTATLLFVSVAAVFAPSIFSQSYAMYKCDHCRMYNSSDHSEGMECNSCRSDVLGVPAKNSMYKEHVMPLVYCSCVLLPIAYVIGLIYSLMTHRALVHDAFTTEVGEVGHGKAQWNRVKSALILLVSVVLMSLCADVVTYNIEPLLGGGISVNFIGVTLLALVPDIPEIVIGIQFALQNNISLSIEVGSCIAVQVCMLQIPVIVFVDLIYVGHNSSALVLTYCAMVAMYFFAPNSPGIKC
ncbi:hypothetical protein LSH36_7g02022 [Paralvinella palmiformis]|uniref:Sodium/calcium exchanger membrane region domain-containing protein n=1 Tax=Paralvinella palmiformis TaxID=53620 RepID=A0AAD9NGS3_9ANNE|nr:hypothetical protein LSH36_7g02022 [Paralvinella palmiformis]